MTWWSGKASGSMLIWALGQCIAAAAVQFVASACGTTGAAVNIGIMSSMGWVSAKELQRQ
jgi:predicted MFS family arabinose efflux permease